MPVSIIENFSLGTNLALDNRYVTNSYNDVSLYWYPGMQVFQESDNQLYWYDGSIWNAVVDTSLSGNFATVNYVDGSLAIRDTSIANNTALIEANDPSGNYLKSSGGTLSGDLLVETDISINGKGSFGEFNVSGSSFPSSPLEGDIYYKNDSGLQYAYDSSRGKWLSTSKTSLLCGRGTAFKNSTVYMEIGGAAMSSTQGIKMFRDGTVLSVSIDNATTTTANRILDVRVNDSTTNRIQLTVGSGNKGAYLTNGNLDFSAGDLIQAVLLLNSSDTFSDIIVAIEVAWR